MTLLTRFDIRLCLATGALLALVACSGERKAASTAPAKTADHAATTTMEADAQAQVETLTAANVAVAAPSQAAVLAAADLADGTADKVISKCATCGLAMSGHAENAVEAEGYTFHLCSPGCKERFSQDPAAAIAVLPPPTS